MIEEIEDFIEKELPRYSYISIQYKDRETRRLFCTFLESHQLVKRWLFGYPNELINEGPFVIHKISWLKIKAVSSQDKPQSKEGSWPELDENSEDEEVIQIIFNIDKKRISMNRNLFKKLKGLS